MLSWKFSYSVSDNAEVRKIDLMKGRLIGSGSEKCCYLNACNFERCLKVSQKNNSDQIKTEIKYLHFLMRRGITADFLPKFYGEFEYLDCIGYEQECFLDKEHGGVYDSACLLSRYLENPQSDKLEVLKELRRIKHEMISKNIICSDLSGDNMLVVKKGGALRIVIIDGFGTPEIFPLCKYIKWLGRRKIERQWEKLIRRLDRYLRSTDK